MSGFTEKHPWMTYFLAGSAIAGVVTIIKAVAAPQSLNGFGDDFTIGEPVQVDPSLVAMDQLLKGGVVGAEHPPMDDKTKLLMLGGALLVGGAVIYATSGKSRRSSRRRSRR